MPPADGFAEREAREQQRRLQLTEGRERLAAADASGALEALEKAAQIRHGPDAEVGLVRAHMQAGQYRRALQIAAHSSAHLEYPEAAVLYAWLLQAGGQPDVAPRTAAPSDPAVRLAPYAAKSDPVPEAAVQSGTGLLMPGGTRAVVATRAVEHAKTVWLRNGLGSAVAGHVERHCDGGVSVVVLEQALQSDAAFAASPRPPFAGSPAAVIGYRRDHINAMPAWPVLRMGFVGRPASSEQTHMRVELSGGQEDSVMFDGAGRLLGLAVSGAVPHSALLIGHAALSLCADALWPSPTPGMQLGGLLPDAIYEVGLSVTLQVLRLP